MFKRRRLHLPKLPSSQEEFVELLMHSPYSNIHRLTIRNCNETAVVFASNLMLSKLKEAETIHFNATFKVVPRLFYQLLTIFIRFKEHAMPAIHILMSTKNEQLYKAVVLAIHDFVADFHPTIAMCDFEKASRNAFAAVFSNLIIVRCWFHYTKAIYDKIQKIGLGKLYKNSKTFKKWVHQLMALPFLCEEDIRPTYLLIKLSLVGLIQTDLVLRFRNTFLKRGLMEEKIYLFITRSVQTTVQLGQNGNNLEIVVIFRKCNG